MIGAERYWSSRMWAPRYWPKDGVSGGVVVDLDFCETTALSLMPKRRVLSLMPDRRARSLMPNRRTPESCS